MYNKIGIICNNCRQRHRTKQSFSAENKNNKEDNMKKLTAFVMAIALSVSCPLGAYASEVTVAVENTEANTEEAGSSEDAATFEATDDDLASQDKSSLQNETEESDQMAAPDQDILTDVDEEETETSNETETSGEAGTFAETETFGETEVPKQETPDAGSESETETPDEGKVLLQDIGRVDVSIAAALILDRAVVFTVTLTDEQGTGQSHMITLGGGKTDSKAAFTDLAAGVYSLKVTGEGFADYVQTLNVEEKGYLVNLTTGFLAGYPYAEGGLHPGVLLIGDVDRDGDVDDEDKTKLVDAIDSGTVPAGCIADLNGDQKVDLVDLEYLSRGYREARDTTAMIEEYISPAAIHAGASQGTVVEGDLDKLLSSGEKVVLSPDNNAEISAANPVALEFDFTDAAKEYAVTDGIIIETGDDNAIAQAVITVSYEEDGVEHSVDVPVNSGVHYLLKESEVTATRDKNGNIQVHLGAQVTVKKVTLTITAMTNNPNLAEISKVEFVNGMEERIPAPEMDVPQNLTAAAASEQFTLSWEPCTNVTGYEVLIQQGDQEEIIQVYSNSLMVTSFKGSDIKNYTVYKVSVQSINGSWSSGYCDPVDVTPKPSGPPDKPDNVTAVGKYKSILVKWKNMDDTLTYNLYYKLKESKDAYTKVEGISANTYTIAELDMLKEYEIYVTGVNELGESPESIHCAAKTIDLNPAEMVKYNLINRDEEGIPGAAHIISAVKNGGVMTDSPSDTASGTAWGTVDNDAASYYSKTAWDDGGYNTIGANGLTYEFDQAYRLDSIALLPTDGMQYSYAQVRWWAEDGSNAVVRATVQTLRDSEGRVYYMLKLPNAVTAKKLQIGLARYLAGGAYNLITVAEVYFYHYDTLRDEIMALYADDLHTVLKEDVTQKVIDELRIKVNTPDAFGEENPNKTLLLMELDTAEKILNDEKLNDAVEIHNGITTNDINRGFSGLNAWQPLGIAAAAGEKLTIYVGHNTKKTGDSTNLQLVATQYHAEWNALNTVVTTLKVGANEVTVPKIGTSTGVEAGGALYVQYTGRNDADLYAVRVSGGTQVPTLDLYKVTDKTERLNRTMAYVEALDAYVSQIETLHGEQHKNSENSNVNYDYNKQNCILGASDIVLDTMMFSLPAQQILAGAGSGSVQERAGRILDSMDAMEDMMYLFYQHKGLNAGASEALNQIPKGHLNIRYQRMFSGAFMYASGNHIGIEWPETASMVRAVPIVSDEKGSYVSGNYFGWGIAHEIGHCINQGSYAVAEITNNYFAQLAQAKDTNKGMRFDYNNIYAKVTSGTKGNSSNGATQLGMYWQLHLAYDKGYNYKTYPDYTEQLKNLFYARVDTYARNTKAAPAPGGVSLTLGSSTDQNLMRLSCAAAEKNILEFFERWGKTPDETTIAYAEQFEKESRAICYVSDDSRVYALNGSGSHLKEDGATEAVGNVTLQIGADAANKVNMTFTSVNVPESDVLGYEIVRCTIAQGQVEKMPVGFATDGSFVDTVTTLNNRTVFYEVTLVDKYLNRSAVKATETIKIEHDGALDKANWSISTSGLTAEAAVQNADEWLPCEATVENPAEKAIDKDSTTVYEPTVTDAGNAEILLEFNRTLVVSGLKYTAGAGTPLGDCEIQVCQDGQWISVAEKALNGNNTVYFANADTAYISTYAATAVKVIIKGQSGMKVSVAELDVLGVTGDNVDFRRTDDDGNTAVIGNLAEAYQYGESEKDIIPAGSLIFTGSYKGNPAYNVVLLYDQNGNIVGGVDAEGNLQAHQIILADVPAEGNIANVSAGTWIYWIEPEQLEKMEKPEKVRAELYRVNNALTNEGQRLVSDSLFEALPEALPDITLSGSERQ